MSAFNLVSCFAVINIMSPALENSPLTAMIVPVKTLIYSTPSESDTVLQTGAVCVGSSAHLLVSGFGMISLWMMENNIFTSLANIAVFQRV